FFFGQNRGPSIRRVEMEEYQAAKWLKVPVLASAEEFAGLFKRLGGFSLYRLGTPGKEDGLQITQDAFLDAVRRWIERLQAGQAVAMSDCRAVLACALSADPECLRLKSLSDGRSLVKIRRPVIQLQAHFFSFSQDEKS